MKYFFLIILAFLIFLAQLYRPIDGSNINLWREVDVGSIARNYYQENMNPFYPRIDWRGAGPGFVESEFPLQSWLGANLYILFGYHEWLLRLIAMIATLGSCIVFFFLAGMLLSEKAAFLASLIFILHPLVTILATAVQPEPLMLFGYLSAIYFFLRWIQSDNMLFYCLAIVATTAAILIKLPSAHIGIFFALLSFQRFGLKAFLNVKLWCFAIITLGVPYLWYDHARTFWIDYGNSLGLSNEAYGRIGKMSLEDFLRVTILGNILTEIKKVWIVTGVILGAYGAMVFFKEKERNIILFWGVSLAIFYLLSGGTTGEGWAAYYHIVSAPFAALLIAQGYFSLMDSEVRWKRITALGLLLALIIVEIGYFFHVNLTRSPVERENYSSAQQFKPLIPQNVLIIANGGPEYDSQGRSLASNPPYFFFWLDRKGFTLHSDQQTMETLQKMREKGAQYFVIEKKFVESAPQFYKTIFEKFKIVDQTDAAILVDLRDTSDK